jgi:ABC-type antimicrobial peptide transport system permease subunit
MLGLLATALIIPLIESASGGMLEDTVFLSFEIVIGGFLIGLIIAFMSAAVPAYQALRLKVVDALREG